MREKKQFLFPQQEVTELLELSHRTFVQRNADNNLW